MKKIIHFLFCLLCCFKAYSGNLDSLKNKIDSIAKSDEVVGFSAAVIEDGEVSWLHQYGVRSVDEASRIDSLTLFQCASISKPITALGVLKLYEEGKIDLDSNVNIYLMGWQLKENRNTKDSMVTVRRLLNHTAGTNFHSSGGSLEQDVKIPSLIGLLNGEGENPKIKVRKVPGTIFKYSNECYTILQKLIEDVSGEKFEDFMQLNVFKPLNMTNSTFRHLKKVDSTHNIASGHWSNNKMLKDGWRLEPNSAAGGLWTTPSDLCNYIIEVQKILAGKNDGVLKRGTVLEMLKPGLPSGGSMNWALGPAVRKEKSGLWYFGHSGYGSGYKSIFDASFDVSQGGFVFLFNSEVSESLIPQIYTPVFNYYGW